MEWSSPPGPGPPALPKIATTLIQPLPRANRGSRGAVRCCPSADSRSHQQHSSHEHDGAAQEHQTDYHEQRTDDDEYRPPAGPDLPGDVREARSTVWIGWTGGRVPHHQVPAKWPHFRHSLPSRKAAASLYSGFTLILHFLRLGHLLMIRSLRCRAPGSGWIPGPPLIITSSSWLRWSTGGQARCWQSWRGPLYGIGVPRALCSRAWIVRRARKRRRAVTVSYRRRSRLA